MTDQNGVATAKKIDFAALTIRPARADEAARIAALVNSAYRGDSSRQGWTTEADLLIGARIDATEVGAMIAEPDSLILLGVMDEDILACVYLKKEPDSAYFGMFVVRPGLQGGGIGKQFIGAAETHAQTLWGVDKIWMTVITLRSELIAFYERRGYRRSGRVKPFPSEVGLENMLVPNLQLEELEKILPGAAALDTPIAS